MTLGGARRSPTQMCTCVDEIGLQLDVDRGASEKVEGSIEADDMNETYYTEEDDRPSSTNGKEVKCLASPTEEERFNT